MTHRFSHLSLPWFLEWGRASGDYSIIMLGDREFCRFGGALAAVTAPDNWQQALNHELTRRTARYCLEASDLMGVGKAA